MFLHTIAFPWELVKLCGFKSAVFWEAGHFPFSICRTMEDSTGNFL